MSELTNPEQLREQLRAALPSEVHKLLQRAATVATAQGVALYLVGGPVRDLILHRPITDLDLVVAGDAWPVAEAFSAAVGGKLIKHAAFRTAVVESPAGDQPYAIDFVTARREVYPTPAALPEITPSHMQDDLARRDFTVNALALAITTDTTDTFLDPFGGVADIAAENVRVLHDRSFVDDPTRILRAARFAARLGFTVEPHTHQLLVHAVAQQMIARTSPQRILNELWLVLEEPQPEAALALLNSWTTFRQLELVWSADWLQQFPKARLQPLPETSARLVGFGLLVWPMSASERSALAGRYNLPTAERKLLHELPLAIPPALLQKEVNDSQLEQLLQQYGIATLHTLGVVSPDVAAARITRYINAIRPLPPVLSGQDLRIQGVAPGPQYRQILAAARQAQLRGEIHTREAALGWLAQHVESPHDVLPNN